MIFTSFLCEFMGPWTWLHIGSFWWLARHSHREHMAIAQNQTKTWSSQKTPVTPTFKQSNKTWEQHWEVSNDLAHSGPCIHKAHEATPMYPIWKIKLLWLINGVVIWSVQSNPLRRTSIPVMMHLKVLAKRSSTACIHSSSSPQRDNRIPSQGKGSRCFPNSELDVLVVGLLLLSGSEYVFAKNCCRLHILLSFNSK